MGAPLHGVAALLPALPTPVVRLAYRHGYRLARGYWYVARPAVFGVKCVLERDDGAVLLVRHTYGDLGAWGLPGGGRHGTEPAAATATREVAEEVGATVEQWTQLGEIYTEAMHKRDTVTVLLGRWPGGEIMLQATELADAQWYGPGEWPERLAFEAQFAIERLAERTEEAGR